MEFFKVCPTCNIRNHPSDMLCNICMADISSVLPDKSETRAIPDTKPEENGSTILEGSSITLKFSNGIEKKVNNGDIIGRNFLGSDILQDYKTVSRQHARFVFENGKWFVEDLNSSNGVFIENIRIPPNTRFEIKNNEKLSISKSLPLTVIIN